MLFWLLTLPLTVPAQVPVSPPPVSAATDQSDPIIVTGVRLSNLKKKLADCIARQCPPDEDANAAIAVAEAQFVDGDYGPARLTVAASIDRTKRRAREYPVPVSDLYRTRGRLAAHLGEYEERKLAVIRSYEVLRSGLAPDDPRVIGGLVELGDLQVNTGNFAPAENYYRTALSRADDAGRAGLAAVIRFRLASLLAGPADRVPSASEERRVSQILAPLLAPGARQGDAFAARLFKARVAERRGVKGAFDALLLESPAALRKVPLLLSATPIVLDSRTREDESNVANRRSDLNVERQWIDIGFWITPQGGVRDVEILRESDRHTAQWSGKIIASILSRRYTPATRDLDDPGLYRVERYTLTAGYEVLTGSRIRSRMADSKIEMLDLTAGDAPS